MSESDPQILTRKDVARRALERAVAIHEGLGTPLTATGLIESYFPPSHWGFTEADLRHAIMEALHSDVIEMGDEHQLTIVRSGQLAVEQVVEIPPEESEESGDV
ncbi:MAG: hypothetical protein NVSMB46_03560 [Candidatus Saccharimonadales bacterium]